MPDATPPRPLTAEDVEQRLLADVAEARAQLAEITAERDRLRTDLADAEKADDDLVSEILRNMREEDGDDIAPGALCVRYVRSLEGGREKLLAANQRWAQTLGDVQQRHAEVKRERDDARKAFAKLAAHFTQGAQSGWTARISGTVLRRLCAMAGCEPPSGTGLEALAEASELVAERDAHKVRADHYEGLWRAEHGLPPEDVGDHGRDHDLAAKVRAVIARYKADDVNALTAFADIMDAAGDTEDAEAETASVLADPETMAAIAEGERDLRGEARDDT